MTGDFSDSYAEARARFLAAARSATARIHSYARDDLTGRYGEELACDVAVLGPEAAERAAIVISGTHGAEGYCGSAILHRWLTSRARIAALERTADRLDHWLMVEGRDDPERDLLRASYKDVCCPRDIAWRRMVLAEGPAIIDRLIDGVRDWAG